MIKKTQTLVLVLFLGFPLSLNAYQNDSTTVILARHAEKMDDGTKNPPLTIRGKERAMHLYTVLSDFKINTIYSTPYKRTMFTAQPTADSLGLEIQTYNFDALEEFLGLVISENSGKAVLIVGHSNTTPFLVNMILGEDTFEQLGENDYGDLFIVTTNKLGTGVVTLSKF